MGIIAIQKAWLPLCNVWQPRVVVPFAERRLLSCLVPSSIITVEIGVIINFVPDNITPIVVGDGKGMLLNSTETDIP